MLASATRKATSYGITGPYNDDGFARLAAALNISDETKAQKALLIHGGGVLTVLFAEKGLFFAVVTVTKVLF